MLIHFIAIEDEPPALKKIEGFINKIPELKLEEMLPANEFCRVH